MFSGGSALRAGAGRRRARSDPYSPQESRSDPHGGERTAGGPAPTPTDHRRARSDPHGGEWTAGEPLRPPWGRADRRRAHSDPYGRERTAGEPAPELGPRVGEPALGAFGEKYPGVVPCPVEMEQLTWGHQMTLQAKVPVMRWILSHSPGHEVGGAQQQPVMRRTSCARGGGAGAGAPCVRAHAAPSALALELVSAPARVGHFRHPLAEEEARSGHRRAGLERGSEMAVDTAPRQPRSRRP